MESILLLHGALGSKQQFLSVVTELEKTMNVYTFNFEGHGGRVSTQPFSMDLFVENVIAFLDEHQLQKTAVFGYSMGGYVALKCALKRPERIDKITTLGTKFDWTPVSATKEVKLLNPEVIEEKVPKFAQKLMEEHAPLDWKEVMNKTATMMLNLGNGEAITESEFQKIAHQVVIVRGAEDAMVSKEESLKTQELLVNATYKEIAGVPHPIDKIDKAILLPLILE